MELVLMKEKDLAFVQGIDEQSFPQNEKKPFEMILDICQRGQIEIYLICHQKENIGIAIIDIYKDMILLDYFAIAKPFRKKGYGSQALHLLQDKYQEKMFVLEIESPDVPCHNLMQRQKRKQFYVQNQMKSTGYLVCLGTIMEVFYYQKPICFKQYQQLYKVLFHRDIGERIMLEDCIEKQSLSKHCQKHL